MSEQTQPPRPDPAGRRPALGPARHAAARAARACGRSRGRPGVVLLVFIVAAVIALILNPMVSVLQRGRASARPRGRRRLPRRSSPCWSSSGSCWPTRSPTRSPRSRATCRASSTTRTSRSPTCRRRSTTRASTSRSRRQGETALQTLQDQVLEGSGEVVVVHRRPAARARRGLDPARPRPRAVHLHALYGAADRRRSCGGSCRRATARPRTTTRRGCRRRSSGYVRGQLLFSTDHGHERRAVAVDLRRRSGSSRPARLRAGVRRVLRADGARSRSSARSSARCRRSSSRCFDDPLTALWVGAAVPRAAAARGPRRRAAGLRPHAADQPAARDLRAAVRRPRSTGSSARSSRCRSRRSLRETVLYLRRHLVLEPWGTGAARDRGRRRRTTAAVPGVRRAAPPSDASAAVRSAPDRAQ